MQYGSLYEYCNFAYDGYGRRTSKSYSYDPNPGSTSDYSYMYTTTYDYDASGRLIHETCVERYTYTGGGSHTRDITYLYDESGIVGAIQKYDSTEETYYFDKNIKGDVIGIYNSSGTRIANYSYDSWGNCTPKTLVSNNFSTYNPIRYRGYYYDRETRLYYLNARYYDPAWRRFISPDDTAYLDPDTPSGLNLYAYCNNDPINFSDPNGHDPEWWQWVISGTLLVIGMTLAITTAPIAATATGFLYITATIGGIIGSGMMAAGVGSIIGGYVNEKNGGSFNAGYWGGMLSGFVIGATASIGGSLLVEASAVSNLPCFLYFLSGYGISFIGGFLGNYWGTKVTSMKDNSYFDQKKTIAMSLAIGLLNIIAAYGSQVTAVLGKEIASQSTFFGTIMISTLTASSSVAIESFFDIVSYILGVLFE